MDTQEKFSMAIQETRDEGAAAAGPVYQESEVDLKKDCDNYLRIIKKIVGTDDGERKPMMIALLGTF